MRQLNREYVGRLSVRLGKMLISVALACPVICGFARASADTPPLAARDAGYTRLSFSDDFDSLDMSSSGGGDHRWFNGLSWYGPVNPKQFTASGGFLRLETHVDPRTNVLATGVTTMPRTKGSKRVFRFGYFEARLRFAPGPYAWPAFWLLSEDRLKFDERIGKGKWCEIDIFEGGRANYFQGTVHDWRDFKSITNENQHFPLRRPIQGDQWNTYGMLWTPQSISWFFNGELLGSTATPEVCKKQNLFMIIGAQKRRQGPSPEVLDVDWVHVYR